MILLRLSLPFILGLLMVGCATSPLMIAAKKGETDKVLSLLPESARINECRICPSAPRLAPTTALECAAYHGQLKVVELFLSKGARTDAHVCGGGRRTALMLAARRGHAAVVRALLASGAEVDFGAPYSALGEAVADGHAEVVKLLLDAGANPAATAAFQTPALMWASRRGYTEIVGLLTQAASKNARGVTLQSSDRVPTAVEPASPNPREAEKTLTATSVSKQELENIVKAAIQASVSTQNREPEKETPIHSDVDNPTYQLPERINDFALVVGIGKYSGDLPQATFAERDAKAVRDHLVALGFPERNIKFLTGNRATRSQLEAHVEDWLPRMAREGSRVLFYFSGHGAPDPKSNQAYLVPVDGDPNFLERTGYPLKRLYAKLGALKAKSVLVALDSCFSGAGGRSVLAEGTRPLVNKADVGLDHREKITLFAAASATEITSVLKDQGHGIFTYYFLKGLSGEGKDSSGVVTPGGLYDYLRPRVQDAAARQNRDQTPIMEGPTNEEIIRFR